MAGICTASSRKNGAGCDHRSIVINLDGTSITLETTEAGLDGIDLDSPARELLNLVPTLTVRGLIALCGVKRQRVLGVTLDNLVNRVVHGEEATNVKQFLLLSRDVTKTNIGTSYVDIPPGLNGERSLVEFTGCTQFRLVANVNMIGSGNLMMRVVRDSDSAVLYESPNISGAGEKELDTDWQTLPAAASGLGIVRCQAKSSVSTDDPQFHRIIMLVR